MTCQRSVKAHGETPRPLDAGQPGALSPEPWSAVLRLTQRLLEAGEHVVDVPAKLPPGSGC